MSLPAVMLGFGPAALPTVSHPIPCAKLRPMWCWISHRSLPNFLHNRIPFVILRVLRGELFFCDLSVTLHPAMQNSTNGFTPAELRKLRSLKNPHGIQL